MANPTIIEKIQTLFNVKRVENGIPEVDFDGFVLSLPQSYSGPQSTKNTIVYAVPAANSNNIGRLKIFLDRLNFAVAVGLSVPRNGATRIAQLLPALSDEFGLTLTAEDVVDDVLPAGTSFTLTASSSNRMFVGSTTVSLE